MKLLLENWRKFLTEDEDEPSIDDIISQHGERIADLWYNPDHRGQALSLIRTFDKDETNKDLSNEEWIKKNHELFKKLRIWRIYLPRLTSRQLDSFWTFAEAEAIVDQLNEEASKTEGEEFGFYIKDYQVVNENSFGKIATVQVEFKNEEDFASLSHQQKFRFANGITRAFDDAAEAVVPNRFEKGGRHGIDQARFDRNYD